jgi:hypothetical protein
VNTASNPLVFYSTAPYGGTGQTAKLKFKATNVGGAGTAYHAKVGYVINAPFLSSVSAPVGEIFTGHEVQCMGCNVIGAGGTLPALHGIQWTANWTSPNSFVHGQVGMTQIADITIYEEFTSGAAPNDFYDFPPSVDSDAQFGQTSGLPQTATLNAGSTVTYQSVDDPYVRTNSCLSKVWPSEYFTDYFSFQPDAKGSYTGIPVTAGTLSWQWSAYTTHNGTWSEPVIVTALGSSSLVASTSLPVWYNNAQDLLKSEGAFASPC